jgi:predicted metal-binding protein
MGATLHVCITCRAAEPVREDAPCAGARMYAALTARPAPEGVTIRPVECLSACKNGAAIALSGPGRWSYIYGPVTEENVEDILLGGAAYAQTPDGIVPWRERPALFRKNVIARLPALVSEDPQP